MDNPSFDTKVVLDKLYKLQENVDNELSKETPNDKIVTKLRFEQLLKGISLTQNPMSEYL